MERHARLDDHDYIGWQIRFVPSDAARHSFQTGSAYDAHARHHDRPYRPESGHVFVAALVLHQPGPDHSVIQESARQNWPYAKSPAPHAQSPAHRHIDPDPALNAPAAVLALQCAWPASG